MEQSPEELGRGAVLEHWMNELSLENINCDLLVDKPHFISSLR